MVRSSHFWNLLLLVSTTFVWGTTFPLLKDAVATLSPAVLVSSRFVVAALAFVPFCRQLYTQLIRDGVVLGVVVFTSYVTQVIGLESVSANRAAFVTSLNVMLVPMLGLFLGRSVSARVFIAAGLALAGIGVMSWEGGSLNWGDLWIFVCALTYAIYILLLEAIAPKHNPLPLTAVQLITVASCGIIWALPETSHLMQQTNVNWGAIVYLGLIATAATTWTQTVAQQKIPAAETAIIYTLEPVFAAIFSFWWLNERLGARGLLGAGMVLGAMIFSQTKPQRT